MDNSAPLIISAQLHSRNDVREWNALFRKGATSLKIDPHFLPGVDQFLLNHDTPRVGKQQPYYSTLQDVLDYFQSPPSWLSGRSIAIALCFKAAPKDICNTDPSNDAQQWLQMAFRFFQNANKAVALLQQHYGIALTWVLDGDAKPCGCLSQAFRPWNSTWIDRDACSLECYQSDEGFCQRYTILNQPYNLTNWKNMSTHHYGKFGGNDRQTLQVWEPDAQDKIDDLIDVYTKVRYQGVPSGSGLAFAINMDVAMFQVSAARALAGTQVAQGFNRVVDSHLQNATHPWISLARGKDGPLLEAKLQYDTGHNQRVERALSLEPFTQIAVGPARPVDPHKVETRVSEFFQTHLNHRFPNTTTMIDSKSALYSIGNNGKHRYSFLFVAAQGQVFAGATNHSQTDNDFTGFKILGLGTRVHASALNNTLLLITEGNYCYNSHVHNTQPAPRVCEPQVNTSLACRYAIDYTVGVAENWYQWLHKDDEDNKPTGAVVTPCNEQLLHGTMTAGHNPWGALFPMPATTNQVGILVAHEPYPSSEESPCGTPYRGEQGIVLSSFASVVVPPGPWESTTKTEEPSQDRLRGTLLLLVAVAGISFLCGTWAWRRRRRSEDYKSVQSENEDINPNVIAPIS